MNLARPFRFLRFLDRRDPARPGLYVIWWRVGLALLLVLLPLLYLLRCPFDEYRVTEPGGGVAWWRQILYLVSPGHENYQAWLEQLAEGRYAVKVLPKSDARPAVARIEKDPAGRWSLAVEARPGERALPGIKLTLQNGNGVPKTVELIAPLSSHPALTSLVWSSATEASSEKPRQTEDRMSFDLPAVIPPRIIAKEDAEWEARLPQRSQLDPFALELRSYLTRFFPKDRQPADLLQSGPDNPYKVELDGSKAAELFYPPTEDSAKTAPSQQPAFTLIASRPHRLDCHSYPLRIIYRQPQAFVIYKRAEIVHKETEYVKSTLEYLHAKVAPSLRQRPADALASLNSPSHTSHFYLLPVLWLERLRYEVGLQDGSREFVSASAGLLHDTNLDYVKAFADPWAGSYQQNYALCNALMTTVELMRMLKHDFSPARNQMLDLAAGRLLAGARTICTRGIQGGGAPLRIFLKHNEQDHSVGQLYLYTLWKIENCLADLQDASDGTKASFESFGKDCQPKLFMLATHFSKGYLADAKIGYTDSEDGKRFSLGGGVLLGKCYEVSSTLPSHDPSQVAEAVGPYFGQSKPSDLTPRLTDLVQLIDVDLDDLSNARTWDGRYRAAFVARSAEVLAHTSRFFPNLKSLEDKPSYMAARLWEDLGSKRFLVDIGNEIPYPSDGRYGLRDVGRNFTLIRLLAIVDCVKKFLDLHPELQR